MNNVIDLPELNLNFEAPTKEPYYADPEETIHPTRPLLAKNPQPPKFKRGINVLCLVIWPGKRQHELLILRQTESVIHDRDQDRKFLVVEPPCIEISQGKRLLDCYLIDAEKGCTIKSTFQRDDGLLKVSTNPALVDSLLDVSFITQVSTLKPDWKSKLSFGLMMGVIFFLVGLMF